MRPVTAEGQRQQVVSVETRAHETRAQRPRVSLFRRGFWKCNLVVHGRVGESCHMCAPHAQAGLAGTWTQTQSHAGADAFRGEAGGGRRVHACGGIVAACLAHQDGACGQRARGGSSARSAPRRASGQRAVLDYGDGSGFGAGWSWCNTAGASGQERAGEQQEQGSRLPPPGPSLPPSAHTSMRQTLYTRSTPPAGLQYTCCCPPSPPPATTTTIATRRTTAPPPTHTPRLSMHRCQL